MTVDKTLTDIAAVGTPELNYVGSSPEPFDITVVSLKKGAKEGHVRFVKTLHSLYHLEFIGVDDPNLGTFTDRNRLIRALADWAEKNGWKIEMAHVSSKTGRQV